MSLPVTHALIPLASAFAFAKRPVPWKLVFVASLAAAAPDLDALAHPLFGVAKESLYSHRGWTHSLFTALAVGCLAALCHRQFRLPALTVAVVVATAMASHGLLDMMTDSGKPVAYLWPLSSQRLFADWRPLPGTVRQFSYTLPAILNRVGAEMQLIFSILVGASAIRMARLGYTKAAGRK